MLLTAQTECGPRYRLETQCWNRLLAAQAGAIASIHQACESCLNLTQMPVIFFHILCCHLPLGCQNCLVQSIGCSFHYDMLAAAQGLFYIGGENLESTPIFF